MSTLADFNNYKTQIAKANPTGVQMDSYQPSNSAASCPAENNNWHAAATPLPPTPNQELCSCMTQSLSCVVNPSLSEQKYGSLFGYVCGQNPKACAGIAANGEKGTYGAYGMCSSSEQLSFVFNQYYMSQGRSSSACDFKGAAKLQSASSGGSSCRQLIAQAGKDGTKTVTSSPQGTGSGSSGGSAASSSGAASIMATPGVESGLLPMAFIVTVAALSGVGMLML